LGEDVGRKFREASPSIIWQRNREMGETTLAILVKGDVKMRKEKVFEKREHSFMWIA